MSALPVLLGLGGPLQYQQVPHAGLPYIEKSRREVAFYPGGKLELTLALPGDVMISGWDRPVVLVEMEKIIYRLPEDEARSLASRHPLQVRHTQTLATVRVAAPAMVPANIEVNLTVRVPKQRTDLKLTLRKGDLRLQEINGWIEATLPEGSMEIRSVSGYFSGITRLGDIEADLSGKRWEGFGFTAVTHNGKVLLRLPAQYSAALQLQTEEGAISIDYPEQLVEGEAIPLAAVAKKKARSLSATVSEGGAPVRLMTMRGDVRLESKPEP
ncbi:MAG: hypothetical protein HXY20_10925 [Acidobacteria bacterium]|nr:hypothetical protein [Acidobacteriota bacterium]